MTTDAGRSFVRQRFSACARVRLVGNGMPSWIEHRDINDVTLATSLVPDGFLRLEIPRRYPP